ncbi:hypothetical protein IJG93_00805 [Candidatus Saccharibacteria bacterium]|nr:hypothetical protein [Candidatus Saccharibacteria bacterium]
MKFKKLKKSLIASVGIIAALATAAVINIAKVDAWGPTDRPTYTNEKPADYATFNSITNNVAVGDERNFVRIREAGTEDVFTDEVEVIPGHEYEVYIYYHNNAASDTNASGVGVATNVRVSSAYPTVVNTDERGMVSGIIDWSYVTPDDPDNAKEGSVWDEAYVTTKTDGTVLRYKTGTAIIHNGGEANGSVLPDALFTKEGTPIGYNKLTGTLPGCAEYSGHITYTLVAEKTEATLDKQISLDGENWVDNLTAKPGEFVTYKVKFKNTGNTDFTNVIFKDVHDEDLLIRSGSIKVYDVDHTDGYAIEDILDISGYNVGNVLKGALIQITYQMQVREGTSACGRDLKNSITASYNSTENISDTTTVHVDECTTPTPSEEDCKTNPALPGCKIPDAIPETGPLQIALAVLVALGIGAGGFYFWRTHRTLKTVESAVSGPASMSSSTPTVDTSTSTSTNENPSTPVGPAEFSAPAESTPAAPVASEPTDAPEAPVAPEAPENPETPIAPEGPVAPEAPENPETPSTPAAE